MGRVLESRCYVPCLTIRTNDIPSFNGIVSDGIGTVSHQAVCEVLGALTTARLIRSIQPAGSQARHEARVGDNHHFVCRSCGAIVDVDCPVGEAPCLIASDVGGFAVEGAEVVYWGLCPDCWPAQSS